MLSDGERRIVLRAASSLSTAPLVGAIAPTLERAEIERAERKSTENLDAYESYMRGIASLGHAPSDRKANSDALDYFLKAIERDPDFAAV
jgi:hypothetical protein